MHGKVWTIEFYCTALCPHLGLVGTLYAQLLRWHRPCLGALNPCRVMQDEAPEWVESASCPTLYSSPQGAMAPSSRCSATVNDMMIISKTGATRCEISRLKCTKFDFRWGFASDLAGGAYSASPGPLAVFKRRDYF